MRKIKRNLLDLAIAETKHYANLKVSKIKHPETSFHFTFMSVIGAKHYAKNKKSMNTRYLDSRLRPKEGGWGMYNNKMAMNWMTFADVFRGDMHNEVVTLGSNVIPI